ncbi:lasso peptide biosynthesis PqqD family chaperone [Paenibacillus sp. HWE-109]|uniref:lasso peptide biosynthesis PqqD family chaperone n=1 Tax=Paenibacillus sp. HWE-109 TaxID=1306526 RepID=UPI001EE05C85|nr:lasso peptide biosynthesis PqqD family chaperone [Paenibacillus sp. HWE-109]UKS24926.1 lasso peptide biosynthesis PqqD family chaperone [Paenibacillus sp. HWE-109]
MMKNDVVSVSQKNVFVQSQGNIVSDMGGEKVMLSIHNGKYYNLGEIGGRIWELLAEPSEVAQIVSLLMAEYEVEQQECEQEVITFIERLSKEGLIEFGEDHGHL